MSHVCTLIYVCMLHEHRNDWGTSKAYLSKQQKVIRKLESLHGVYFKNPSSFFLIFNFFDPTQPPESYFTSCFAYQHYQSFLLKTSNMILLLSFLSIDWAVFPSFLAFIDLTVLALVYQSTLSYNSPTFYTPTVLIQYEISQSHLLAKAKHI